MAAKTKLGSPAMKSFCRRPSLWFCVILLLTVNSGFLAAQNVPALSPADMRAADAIFDMQIDPKLKIRNLQLKDIAPTFADGSRGYPVPERFEVGTVPYSGNRIQDSEILLGHSACSSSLVAVVQAVGSPAHFLIHGNQGIITAYSLKISQVLKGEASAGSPITAIQFGGSISDHGQEFRIVMAPHQAIDNGFQYLLFLYKSPEHPSDSYFLLGYSQDRVLDGKIIASPRKSDEIIDPPLRTGEAVSAFAERMDKAIALMQSKGSCQ